MAKVPVQFVARTYSPPGHGGHRECKGETSVSQDTVTIVYSETYLPAGKTDEHLSIVTVEAEDSLMLLYTLFIYPLWHGPDTEYRAAASASLLLDPY